MPKTSVQGQHRVVAGRSDQEEMGWVSLTKSEAVYLALLVARQGNRAKDGTKDVMKDEREIARELECIGSKI